MDSWHRRLVRLAEKSESAELFFKTFIIDLNPA